MEFSEVVKRRRMYRSFVRGDVDKDLISAVLKTALSGPSAGFSQGIEYLVLQGNLNRSEFWTIITTPGWLDSSSSHRGLDQASAILIPLVDESRYIRRYSQVDKLYSRWNVAEDWPVPYWIFDAGASVMLALLKVTELGLGALFLSVDRGIDELREAFGIPANLYPIGAIVIGVPSTKTKTGSPTRLSRRPLEETIHMETYKKI